MYLKVERKGDYHEDMGGLAAKPFVAFSGRTLCLVPDNASYHNLRVSEKITPTSNFRKQDMIEWLREKGIHVDPLMLKA